MAKTQKNAVVAQDAPKGAAAADLGNMGATLAAGATMAAAAVTVRHSGASAAVLAAGNMPASMTKHGAQRYSFTAKGATSAAGRAAKIALGGEYPAWAALVAAVAANGGSCTAQEYWDAVAAAGLLSVVAKPFSKRGSTAAPDATFNWAVRHVMQQA